MGPYKNAGRFNPKYLTDEEISELDGIEAEIEDIIEGKKTEKSTLDKEDRKKRKKE